MLKSNIYTAWTDGYTNVLAVAPTGFGKTVLFSSIAAETKTPMLLMVHRQELVSQMSITLARHGVKHNVIGPKNVVKLCVNNHMRKFGKSFYDLNAQCSVAGVDTLLRRTDSLQNWLNSVTRFVVDEGHHATKENKWGKAAALMPNAQGLFVTATPLRTDGVGLGRGYGGIVDKMVEGPALRQLINTGYLTDYKIYSVTTEQLDLDHIPLGKDGEYNQNKLTAATRNSKIVGSVVEQYLKIAPGKLGITFVTDLETASEISDEYNRHNVPAAVISSKTKSQDRIDIMTQFERRELLQLVNVDIVGEGFDMPGVEVISMARKTKSFGLYVQQFGRVLRLMISDFLMQSWDSYTDQQRLKFISDSSKSYGVVIDHVGNVPPDCGGHGLPDRPMQWTLENREIIKSNNETLKPVKVCTNCAGYWEGYNKQCPYCGVIDTPQKRAKPEQVEGDLLKLCDKTLRELRGEIEHSNRSEQDVKQEMINKNAPQIGVLAQVKRHRERKEIQSALKQSMAWWAGYHNHKGIELGESYRRFYYTFQIDVLTAQLLNKKDSVLLAEKINEKLGEFHNEIFT